jgi:hypothetical protein
LLLINRRLESDHSIRQRIKEEEKEKQGMNYRICGSIFASTLYQTVFGLPVVKHAQQTSRGSEMENRQGRLDSDSHPEAEEFRVSSS